jgi:hypothetical protein
MGSGTEPGAASFDQTASNPEQGETPPPFVPVPEKKSNGPLIGGLVLITLGCIFLAERFIPRIDFGDLWPLIIVVIGVVLIATSFSERNKGNTPS